MIEYINICGSVRFLVVVVESEDDVVVPGDPIGQIRGFLVLSKQAK